MPTNSPGRPTGRTRSLVGAATALLALTLAACSSAGATGSPSASGDDASGVVLTVGELGAALTQQSLLEAAGEADGLDYEVEYALFPSGPAFMEAVPSGAVDLALMADTPAIFAQVGGIPVKVVGVQRSVADGRSFVEIVTDPGSGIDDVADLEGKKVALLPATILQYTVARVLEAEGLDYADITPVELPLTDAVAALAKGDVDAVASLDPTLAQLKANGAVTVGDGVGVTSGYSYVVATDAALADPAKEAAVADYLGRLGRAEQWAVENPDAWAATYSELTGLPVEISRAVRERSAAGWVPIDDEVIATQQEQADVYTELGLIAETLDVSLEFDDRFNDVLVGGAA
ncbi:ABC transporter substrate-binding protein [Cellulosimicrobium sp. PMB13]|uniref:ABC transporter substrate-binding protein n=1 Tax=Cellulosimicrobium sp. PMB13 TaxID=3120158 RepID=UPI003F4B0A72